MGEQEEIGEKMYKKTAEILVLQVRKRMTRRNK